MDIKSLFFGICTAAAVSSAQAAGISEIQADRLDFRLIPVVADEKDIPPDDRENYRLIEFQTDMQAGAEEPAVQTFNVSKKVYLTQNDVEDVRVTVNVLGVYALNIKFTKEGRRKLKEFSQVFLGRRTIVMNREQGVYYSDPVISSVLDGDRIEVGGGIPSLAAAQKAAEEVGKRIEFRGVEEGVTPSAGFETLTLKSLGGGGETSFALWANPDRAISAEDMEKVRLLPLGAEYGGTGNSYQAVVDLKERGWAKMEGLTTAALVGNNNKFLKFVTDHGSDSLMLEVFVDEEQKKQFMRKITK